MGWEYFTLLNDDNILEESFNILLQQCCINKDKLLLHLNRNNCYRFIVNTSENNDRVYCKNGKYMLRSKFMTNKNFKKSLIEYYRQYGVYVNGPKNLVRKDGTIMDKWIIELTLSVKNRD
jgi:hypothetical protein